MNTERLSELERKWLNGTISKLEADEYAQWYNTDQNKPISIPEFVAKSKQEHKVKMLENIILKITDSTAKQPLKQSRNYKLTIAATLIFCLGILGYTLKVNFYPDHQENQQLEDIPPGQSGLVLTLDDGRNIYIDSLENGVVVDLPGLKIIKKDDIVHYEGNAKEPEKHTASTQKGRTYQLILPDKSKVWLNASSTLRYPSSFSAKNRQVELTGEAYFEVTSNPKKPFVVKANSQEITVLGTHFNIKNYPDESLIATTLVKGSIRVKTNSAEKIIYPDQKVISGKLGGPLHVEKVNSRASTNWTKGIFDFNNSDIRTIMKQIERWYDVEVVIIQGVDENQLFFGQTSKHQNLSEVLKVLRASGLNIELEDNKIIIKPNK